MKLYFTSENGDVLVAVVVVVCLSSLISLVKTPQCRQGSTALEVSGNLQSDYELDTFCQSMKILCRILVAPNLLLEKNTFPDKVKRIFF